MRLPLVSTVNIDVKNQNLNGLRILHLSDLHIDKKVSSQSITNLVNICNNTDVDFVVITGDIIDCKVKYIKHKLEILNKLKKIVYYISGNHDLFHGLNELNKVLTNLHFMDNRYLPFVFKDKIIHIVGYPDAMSKYFKIKRDKEKIVNFLKENNDTIFISHQPKDYKIATNMNTPLFLCGHTHGGQIFPFHYLVYLDQPYLAGIYHKNNTTIYVNKGLGTWGIPFRFKANAEITILKLTTNGVK